MERETPPLKTLAFLSEVLKGKARILLSKWAHPNMMILICLRKIKDQYIGL
jgi:hypothetical protein